MLGPSNSSSKVLTHSPATGGRLPSHSGITAGGAAAVIDSTLSAASPSCRAVMSTGPAASLLKVYSACRWSPGDAGRATGSPRPGRAGMKDTTISLSSPTANGPGATVSVGPRTLATWTLGVMGAVPTFFNLTWTSVARLRSHRPTGGLIASHCSPLAAGKTTETD